MKMSELEAIIKGITPPLQKYTDEGDAALAKRIDALEARMVDIQERGIRYRGVFQRADDYQRGDVCTHAGSLWIATDATRQTPGKGSGWQLAVKGG